MPLIKNSNPPPVPEVKVDANPPAAPKVEAPKSAKSNSETMSKAEWAAKDRKAARGFAFNAAMQSPALMQYAPNLEAYIALIAKAADASLAYQAVEE